MFGIILHFLQPHCWEEQRENNNSVETPNWGTGGWGGGGRGQSGGMDGGAGGTISVEGEFNSKPNGNRLVSEPMQSSHVCYEKLCQGQMTALAAYSSWQHLLGCASAHTDEIITLQLLRVPQHLSSI